MSEKTTACAECGGAGIRAIRDVEGNPTEHMEVCPCEDRPRGVSPEVRLNDDGTLDEVVAHGAYFHLEQMGAGHWWMVVTVGDRAVHINLSSSRKIMASYEVCGDA